MRKTNSVLVLVVAAATLIGCRDRETPLTGSYGSNVLAGQVGSAARIANLRIKVRSRWSDILVTVLTAGLISPRSVTFEGTVVPKAP